MTRGRDSEVNQAYLKPGSLGTLLEVRVRRTADDVNGRTADQGSAAIVKALSHADPTQRMLALEIICRFSEERAAPLLIGLLGDSDPVVRRAAASVAERIEARCVVPRLILALDDPDRPVRQACQRALEAITRTRVEPVDAVDPAQRSKIVARLMARWKRERLAELCARANTEGA